MANENFIDFVKIFMRSGRGGGGSASFRREKSVPKGGPDGGDGGRGAHIILKGNKQLWTLLHLKYRKHIHAENGEYGKGRGSTGADGKDVILEVPLGTVVRDAETGEKLAEVMEHDEKVILFRGGRGGLGNTHFKTSTNQAPRYCQPGEEGIESWVILELKILADVGLVGFPNAGKSTLLSVVSKAKPEIADYAFTTTVPNLGIVDYHDNQSFIMADIPGIIEDAHKGKGLGVRFLRHIERNSVLLFIVPADSQDIKSDYYTLLNELQQYNPELMHKDRVLGISKSDLLDDELKEMLKKDLLKDIPTVFFSAFTQKNINELKDVLWKSIHQSDTE